MLISGDSYHACTHSADTHIRFLSFYASYVRSSDDEGLALVILGHNKSSKELPSDRFLNLLLNLMRTIKTAPRFVCMYVCVACLYLYVSAMSKRAIASVF
jgi:hypothetical protein